MAPKKRPGRAAKRGRGRPSLDSPELDAAVAEVVAGKATPEEAAARHGVAPRTVRRRVEASRAVAGPGSAPPAVAAPQVVHLPAERPPAAQPPPPPSEPDPTDAEIEAVDTLAEAQAILRAIRAKMNGADEVRFSSLAEKALSAINRIEQIGKNRPRVPTRDEVTARLVEVAERAVERIGGETGEEAESFEVERASLTAWLSTLGPIGEEVRRRVDLLLDGPPEAAA